MGRLPGEVVAEPDVTDLALTHEVVECPEGLLQRRAGIPAVHLVEIDVVGLQAFQARLDGPQHVHPCRAGPVEVVAHRQAELGGQDDLLPQALQGIPEQGLAFPAGVDVGGIDEVDAAVQCVLHHAGGRGLVQRAHLVPPERHGAQRDLAHDKPRFPQRPVLHSLPPLSGAMIAKDPPEVTPRRRLQEST